MHVIPISNINNTVRFYNALFEQAPMWISMSEACYEIYQEVFCFQESSKTPLPHLFNKTVGKKSLNSIFLRMKPLMSAWAGECVVLKDRFRIDDPDGHHWILSLNPLEQHELIQSNKAKKCYLQPYT